MDVSLPLTLLGGLSPERFMRRHWQKQPLLVRQAWPDVQAPLSRRALFDLAADDAVESRLVQAPVSGAKTPAWRVRAGPLPRRALPPVARPGWTLLVQGLDLHVPAARSLLDAFRFVPDARLDDLMVSWASPGGGVGAHLDAYDVFLLQVQGRRRWRVGAPVARPTWVDGAPLKLLRDFEPVHDWLLEPGDMLYLPPGHGHEGTAEGGDCMTCSIGFRAPSGAELTRDLLSRLADAAADDDSARGTAPYRDPHQVATPEPGQVPHALQAFAQAALSRLLSDPDALARALGESLSEPKPRVWFEGRGSVEPGRTLQLDAATRMLYDARHVYINGEAFRAAGRDATLMRRLADERRLPASDRARLSSAAAALVHDWSAAGWLHAGDG